ncbi:nestin [Mixophyes fleayi]|uniref:nestin n=1 Tax=Mixophyes fleayi TaxID=3061075 RepID=UPI003F4E1BA7
MKRMETYRASISLTEESSQMGSLNKRLESYLSRVKSLEEENEMLRAEITHLKSTRSESCLIRKYHDEIMKLRDALDDGHQDMVQVEMARDDIYREIQYVKELCLQEKQTREDVTKELSESKKILDEEERAQIWLKNRLVQLEEEIEDILKTHDEEKAVMEEEILSYSQRLENFKVAPVAFKPVNVEDYASKLSQIWQGAVEEYKNEVSALETNLAQTNDNLRKVLDENKHSQQQLQNLDRELQSLKARKDMLEDLLSGQWLDQQEEEGKLQLEIEALEKEKQDLRVQIAQVLEERQQLMHLKMSLSLEVATYRSLLEAESTRVYSPNTDYKGSSSFNDSVLEQKTLRKRQAGNRDYRQNASKKQSAETSTPNRYLNVKSTSFSSRASPVTKEFQKVSSVLQSQSLKYAKAPSAKAATPLPTVESNLESRAQTGNIYRKSKVETISQSYSRGSSKVVTEETARNDHPVLNRNVYDTIDTRLKETKSQDGVESHFLLPGEQEIVSAQLKTDLLESSLKTVGKHDQDIPDIVLEDQQSSPKDQNKALDTQSNEKPHKGKSHLNVPQTDIGSPGEVFENVVAEDITEEHEIISEIMSCQAVYFEKQECRQVVDFTEPSTADAEDNSLISSQIKEEEKTSHNILVEMEEPKLFPSDGVSDHGLESSSLKDKDFNDTGSFNIEHIGGPLSDGAKDTNQCANTEEESLQLNRGIEISDVEHIKTEGDLQDEELTVGQQFQVLNALKENSNRLLDNEEDITKEIQEERTCFELDDIEQKSEHSEKEEAIQELCDLENARQDEDIFDAPQSFDIKHAVDQWTDGKLESLQLDQEIQKVFELSGVEQHTDVLEHVEPGIYPSDEVRAYQEIHVLSVVKNDNQLIDSEEGILKENLEAQDDYELHNVDQEDSIVKHVESENHLLEEEVTVGQEIQILGALIKDSSQLLNNENYILPEHQEEHKILELKDTEQESQSSGEEKESDNISESHGSTHQSSDDGQSGQTNDDQEVVNQLHDVYQDNSQVPEEFELNSKELESQASGEEQERDNISDIHGITHESSDNEQSSQTNDDQDVSSDGNAQESIDNEQVIQPSYVEEIASLSRNIKQDTYQLSETFPDSPESKEEEQKSFELSEPETDKNSLADEQDTQLPEDKHISHIIHDTEVSGQEPSNEDASEQFSQTNDDQEVINQLKDVYQDSKRAPESFENNQLLNQEELENVEFQDLEQNTHVSDGQQRSDIVNVTEEITQELNVNVQAMQFQDDNVDIVQVKDIQQESDQLSEKTEDSQKDPESLDLRNTEQEIHNLSASDGNTLQIIDNEQSIVSSEVEEVAGLSSNIKQDTYQSSETFPDSPDSEEEEQESFELSDSELDNISLAVEQDTQLPEDKQSTHDTEVDCQEPSNEDDSAQSFDKKDDQVHDVIQDNSTISDKEVEDSLQTNQEIQKEIELIDAKEQSVKLMSELNRQLPDGEQGSLATNDAEEEGQQLKMDEHTPLSFVNAGNYMTAQSFDEEQSVNPFCEEHSRQSLGDEENTSPVHLECSVLNVGEDLSIENNQVVSMVESLVEYSQSIETEVIVQSLQSESEIDVEQHEDKATPTGMVQESQLPENDAEESLIRSDNTGNHESSDSTSFNKEVELEISGGEEHEPELGNNHDSSTEAKISFQLGSENEDLIQAGREKEISKENEEVVSTAAGSTAVEKDEEVNQSVQQPFDLDQYFADVDEFVSTNTGSQRELLGNEAEESLIGSENTENNTQLSEPEPLIQGESESCIAINPEAELDSHKTDDSDQVSEVDNDNVSDSVATMSSLQEYKYLSQTGGEEENEDRYQVVLTTEEYTTSEENEMTKQSVQEESDVVEETIFTQTNAAQESQLPENETEVKLESHNVEDSDQEPVPVKDHLSDTETKISHQQEKEDDQLIQSGSEKEDGEARSEVVSTTEEYKALTENEEINQAVQKESDVEQNIAFSLNIIQNNLRFTSENDDGIEPEPQQQSDELCTEKTESSGDVDADEKRWENVNLVGKQEWVIPDFELEDQQNSLKDQNKDSDTEFYVKPHEDQSNLDISQTDDDSPDEGFEKIVAENITEKCGVITEVMSCQTVHLERQEIVASLEYQTVEATFKENVEECKQVLHLTEPNTGDTEDDSLISSQVNEEEKTSYDTSDEREEPKLFPSDGVSDHDLESSSLKEDDLNDIESFPLDHLDSDEKRWENFNLGNYNIKHDNLTVEETISEDKDIAEKEQKQSIVEAENVGNEDVDQEFPAEQHNSSNLDKENQSEYMEQECNVQRVEQSTAELGTKSEDIFVEHKKVQELLQENPTEILAFEGLTEQQSDIEDIPAASNLKDENSRSEDSLYSQDISIYSQQSEDFEISKDYQLEQTLPDTTPLPSLDDEFDELADNGVIFSSEEPKDITEPQIPEYMEEKTQTIEVLDSILESESSQIITEEHEHSSLSKEDEACNIEAEYIEQQNGRPKDQLEIAFADNVVEHKEEPEVLAKNFSKTLGSDSPVLEQLKQYEYLAVSKLENENSESEESMNSQEEVSIYSQQSEFKTDNDCQLEQILPLSDSTEKLEKFEEDRVQLTSELQDGTHEKICLTEATELVRPPEHHETELFPVPHADKTTAAEDTIAVLNQDLNSSGVNVDSIEDEAYIIKEQTDLVTKGIILEQETELGGDNNETKEDNRVHNRGSCQHESEEDDLEITDVPTEKELAIESLQVRDYSISTDVPSEESEIQYTTSLDNTQEDVEVENTISESDDPVSSDDSSPNVSTVSTVSYVLEPEDKINRIAEESKIGGKVTESSEELKRTEFENVDIKDTYESETLSTFEPVPNASLSERSESQTSDEEKDTTGESSDSSFESERGAFQEDKAVSEHTTENQIDTNTVNGLHHHTIVQATLDLGDHMFNGHSTKEHREIVISERKTIVRLEGDIVNAHTQDIIEDSVIKFAMSEGKIEGLFHSSPETPELKEGGRFDEATEIDNVIQSAVEYAESAAKSVIYTKKAINPYLSDNDFNDQPQIKSSLVDEDVTVDTTTNQEAGEIHQGLLGLKFNQEKEDPWSSDE